MKKQSILVAVLSMLLVLSMVLAGCAGNGTAEATEAPKTETTTTTEEAPADEPADEPAEEEAPAATEGERKTVSWAFWDMAVLNPEERITSYAFDQMNLTIDPISLDWGTWAEQMKLAAASDSLPDLISTYTTSDMSRFYSWIDQGIIRDIPEDMIAEFEYVQASCDAYLALQAVKQIKGGKIWYFPTMLNGTFQQIGLMMVRSYLDLLGWEQPDNIDDLYDYLCDIRDNDCNGDGDPTDEVPMFNRNGGRVTQMAGLWGCEMASRWTVNADDEKEIDFSYTMDKYLEFLTYYNRLYEEDLMNKDFDSAGLDQQNNLHAYNRVGMNTQYIGLTVDWTLDWDPDWDMDNDPLLHIPVAPLKGGCDKPFWVGRSEVNPTFAINSALEEDKAIAAFCFMDFMIGTEAQIIRNCGTDDEKFEIDYEAGLIHKYDKAFYSDNGSKLGSNFKGIPDNEKWYQVEGLMNYNGRDYTAHLAADAENGWTIVPTIVNCYKLPEEQEIIERYETDLTTYCDEHFSGFIAGNIELTEWDNYVATCESMGSLELDEVYTAVYHRLRGIEA